MITMPKEFSAGTLKVKTPSTFNIPVVNNTTKKLSVDFKTSCGCSAPEPKEVVLEPMQATNVKVTIKKESAMSNSYVKLFATITHIDKVGMVNPPQHIKDELVNSTKINFDVK